MANAIKLEIDTPDGRVYSEHVEMVTLQSLEGQMRILPHHTPLIAQLAPGKMIVPKDGRKDFLAVGEGLVFVSGDLVAILTDMAFAADNIDEARAEKGLQHAAAHLRDKISDEEVAFVNVLLARSLAQLYVKRRRHA
jgi:F-type H+-transporting ATPase subunit epsilon